MAVRDPSRPDPVILEVGGRTLATAYARRPPGKRKGTEHWAWIVAYKDLQQDKPVQQSLGRFPVEQVPTALARFYQEVNPTAVRSDGTGMDTVGDLLRAYYAHLEKRQDSAEALSEHTLLFYLGSSKRLVRFVDHSPLTDLSEPWVLSVRGQLLGEYSVRTVKADLKYLRQAIVWANRFGLEVPDVSVRTAQKFKGRKAKARINNHRTPTEEEVAVLYRAMRRSKTKLAMYLMWQTGCRIGEAAELRWGDITRDDDGCWIAFPKGKTGPRVTPISQDAFVELQHYRPDGAEASTRLFKNTSRMSGNTGAAIAVACQVQGRNIEPFTSHGLRRLFTDRCIRAKVDIATYADISGHSIETALKHYRTVTRDDKIAALHRLMRPSEGDLLAWIARRNITEDEAIRVLEAWQKQTGSTQRVIGVDAQPGLLH